MYMNKNKGISLIEVVATLSISMIIFQSLYFYLKEINYQKKQEFYRLYFNKNIKLILEKIDRSLYESLDYKIYNLEEIRNFIDFKSESLKSGNTLIIEKYIFLEENYKEIEIYHHIDNSIYSFSGKRKGNGGIGVSMESKEKILKNLKIKFNLEKYGASLEGFYLNEKIQKDFKK